jgi:hypothetical protein
VTLSSSRPPSAGSFIVTREETTVEYTGPTVIANGSSLSLSAILREDGGHRHRRPHLAIHPRQRRHRPVVQRAQQRHRRGQLPRSPRWRNRSAPGR